MSKLYRVMGEDMDGERTIATGLTVDKARDTMSHFAPVDDYTKAGEHVWAHCPDSREMDNPAYREVFWYERES